MAKPQDRLRIIVGLMRAVLIVSALVLLGSSAPALADHCAVGKVPPDPTSLDHCRILYTMVCVYADYDADPAEPGCDGPESLYVMLYQESNGIPGFQRGDECQDDTCHGEIESDTWIF